MSLIEKSDIDIEFYEEVLSIFKTLFGILPDFKEKNTMV